MKYGTLGKYSISGKEKSYIRDLAKKQAEYANLPIMKERKQLWYAHNSLKAVRPVVVMEMDTFENDMLPQSRCESAAAIEMEKELNCRIISHELIDDDKVIPPYYTVYWKIHMRQFDIDMKVKHATDSSGRNIGYTWEHFLKNLKEDFSKLKPSVYSVDREDSMVWKAFVEETIGDILPVKMKNKSLFWHVTPSMKIVDLMGLENMMYSMVDYPDELHALYRFIADDILRFVEWQQKEALLELNNENDYTGAGSYGFTTELPSSGYLKSRIATPADLWGNMNSQETIGISPAMYEEFVFPYYKKLAEIFGLVYYGCCEPVHDIWESCISKLPNLRKVSVSAWCNEEFMGDVLKGKNVIYSRKPSPNFIGVGTHFDEQVFSKHIERTLQAARGCGLEFIFRDVYTLSGDNSKAGRAVKITRQLIERMWG